MRKYVNKENWTELSTFNKKLRRYEVVQEYMKS
jgi:hypothetical protein